jgi:hypothetical protein
MGEQLLLTDHSSSIILEECIRRGEQVQALGVGFPELILTGAGIYGEKEGSWCTVKAPNDHQGLVWQNRLI